MILKKSLPQFVLDMIGKMVLAEEKSYGVVSGLRIFGRCDVSIFRNVATGRYEYVVSKVTRSYSTCLFTPWCDPEGAADVMISRLLRVLHRVARVRFLSQAPPPPPTHL